jgi:hypothetical protein
MARPCPDDRDGRIQPGGALLWGKRYTRADIGDDKEFGMWKFIERACIILGLLLAAATLYYTAGAYYGWNQPQPVATSPHTTMTAPWWLYAIGAIGFALLVTAWIMISLRRPRKIESRAPSVSVTQTRDYSDDPEKEATDKQAYGELLAFALDRVIPACEAQVELQKAIITQASGNSVIGGMACMGVEHSDRTKEFWRHYTELADGLLESPGPIIGFETILEHIGALESGAYREFSEQMSEFGTIFSLNVRTNADLKPIWLKWVEAHNALIEAYDPIKRDPRFEKLLRPARPSRWGDRIQIETLVPERSQVATPMEQAIDIRFESQPPYETNEISNGRGLSTVRIGLKASGRTFSNCQVYVEKIAPQPSLPGGMPILLADSAPMLRPDDPEAFVTIVQHWDHVAKYRFNAPLPWHDVQLTYIDDQPSRLIEIKVTARSDAGEFIKTATFKIWVDDMKKIHFQRQ